MPGAFKLDYLQPTKPLFSPNFHNFFTFILGGQFLLPQRANNGKREITQLQRGQSWRRYLLHSSHVVRGARGGKTSQTLWMASKVYSRLVMSSSGKAKFTISPVAFHRRRQRHISHLVGRYIFVSPARLESSLSWGL